MGLSIEEQREKIRSANKKNHSTNIKSKRYYVDSMFIRGIYKLYFNKKVVYIGMSKTNVMKRITDHYRDKNKIFDSFSFRSCNDLSDKQIELMEADLIKKYRPIYNVNHNNDNNKKPKTFIKKKPKSRFKTETKSLKYVELIDGTKVKNRVSKKG